MRNLSFLLCLGLFTGLSFLIAWACTPKVGRPNAVGTSVHFKRGTLECYFYPAEDISLDAGVSDAR